MKEGRRLLTQYVRLFCIILFVMIATRAAAQAQPAIDTAGIDRYLLEQMERNRIPGMAIALIIDGETALVKGYGVDGFGQPITEQTPFLVASVSKSFTALAVMQLADAGQIDLDSPIGVYLPDFATRDPAHDDAMTVRHLLNMVSGLSDDGYAESPELQTLAERVQALRTAQPVAAPGSTWAYFNPNYAVLARLVEVVSGQDFADYLDNHIFTPLGMRNTSSLVLSTQAETLPTPARGHIMVFGMRVAMPESPGNLAGDGGIVTTAEDMTHYLTMYLNGGSLRDNALVTSASIELMHSPTGDDFYGMGWYIADPQRQPLMVEHGGDLATFHADMVLLPEQRSGFVVMYNFNYFPFMASGFPSIKEGVIALMTDGSPPDYLSLSNFGLALGTAALVSLVLPVRNLLSTQKWAGKMLQRPVLLRAMGLILPLIPLAMLAFLPTLVLLLVRRAIDRTYLFMAMPELTLWLGVAAFIGLATVVLRAFALYRQRRSVTQSDTSRLRALPRT